MIPSIPDFVQAFYPLMAFFLYQVFQKRTPYPMVGSFVLILLYHVYNLYWLYNTSYTWQISALILILSLSILPAIYFLSKNRVLHFLIYWLLVEYFHLNFGFPMLVIGHHLANFDILLGMTRYTGIMGLSLLVLCANLFGYYLLRHRLSIQKLGPPILAIALLLVLNYLPSTYSHIEKIKVAALNTQLTCPHPKYSMTPEEMIQLYKNKLQVLNPQKPDLVLLPENAFDNYGFVDQVKNNQINKELLATTPDATFIFGGISLNLAPQMQNINNFDQYLIGGTRYTYNNSIFRLSQSEDFDFRHKYMLVPFNEYIPKPFSEIIPRKVVGYKYFKKPNYNPNVFKIKNIRVGAIICYEGLFGNFVGDMVINGANLLSVHYNEGWYQSLRGSSKMLMHAKIRAAESAKFMVGSSNCGLSFFIDDQGKVLEMATEDLFQEIYCNNYTTFYSKYGNLIGAVCLFYFLFQLFSPFLLPSFFHLLRNKNKHQQQNLHLDIQ